MLYFRIVGVTFSSLSFIHSYALTHTQGKLPPPISLMLSILRRQESVLPVPRKIRNRNVKKYAKVAD